MENTDFDWLVEHGPELFEKYRGRWIAASDHEVIYAGLSVAKVTDQTFRRSLGTFRAD